MCDFSVSKKFIVSLEKKFIYTWMSHNRSKFLEVYIHINEMTITGHKIKYVKLSLASHWEIEHLGIES